MLKDNEVTEYDHEAFLVSVKDEGEASIIEALLETYEIPVMRKFKEAGSYLNIYMGQTSFGIDLFVPSKLLDQAKEIIQSKPVNETDDVELNSNVDAEEAEAERKHLEKGIAIQKFRVWALFSIFLLPVLLGFIGIFIWFISYFFRR